MTFWHCTFLTLFGCLSWVIGYQLGRFRGQEEEKINETVRRINRELEYRKLNKQKDVRL